MILASNGLRTFIFENKDFNLNGVSANYNGQGYCFEVIVYPAQDGSSITSINNVATVASKDGEKAALCRINYNAKSFVWATAMDANSELAQKVNEHYLAPAKNKAKK